MVFEGEQAYGDDYYYSDEYHEVMWHKAIDKKINGSASNAGCGVDFFVEECRELVGKDVANYAAKAACHCA